MSAYEAIVTVGVRLFGGHVKAVAWFAFLSVDTSIQSTWYSDFHDWFAGQSSIARWEWLAGLFIVTFTRFAFVCDTLAR